MRNSGLPEVPVGKWVDPVAECIEKPRTNESDSIIGRKLIPQINRNGPNPGSGDIAIANRVGNHLIDALRCDRIGNQTDSHGVPLCGKSLAALSFFAQ